MDTFIWKQVLQNLVLPPGGLLILAALGLVLAASVRWRRLGFVLSGAALCLLWLLATPRIADHLVGWAQAYPALDARQPLDAQALIVLGGGARADAPEYGGVAPSAATLERLAYAARLARATALPVLVTGSRFEAAAMNEFLRRDLGITAQWTESRSADTYGNARHSWAILGPAGIHNVVLVTSAVHMARARAEFEAAGFHVIPAPMAIWTPKDDGFAPWAPSADGLIRSQRVLHELLGKLVRLMRPGPTAISSTVRSGLH
jgi:uncharacterized SAM-binding protein YcdF (DUF218 family)